MYAMQVHVPNTCVHQSTMHKRVLVEHVSNLVSQTPRNPPGGAALYSKTHFPYRMHLTVERNNQANAISHPWFQLGISTKRPR
jgi:hypothetical protein